MRKVYFLLPSFYLVVDIKREIKWRVVGAIKRSSVNEETLFPTLQRVLEEKGWLLGRKVFSLGSLCSSKTIRKCKK